MHNVITKQSALMDKVGKPFILQQQNPMYYNGEPITRATNFNNNIYSEIEPSDYIKHYKDPEYLKKIFGLKSGGTLNKI